MAALVKRFTGFMSPAPKSSAPKRIPSDADADPPSPSQDANMNKGIKRKVNPYDDFETEGSVESSPAPTQRASSRRSSETPASARKTPGRQSAGKAKRRSRASIQKPAAADESSPLKSAAGEDESSAHVNGDADGAANDDKPRAPMAPMANMDSLGPLEPLGNSNSVLNPSKPATSSGKPARDEVSTDKAKPASDKEPASEKEPTNDKEPASDGKSAATEEADDGEAPVDKDANHMVEAALEKKEFAETAQDEECEVERLLKHRRLADGTVEVLVKWADEPEEDATYEPEEEIQRGAAEALYDYWKAQGGRTERLFYKSKNPPPETYHVFKILGHQKQKTVFEFEVQWVGYPATPKNTSMETETKLKKICPSLVAEYWESVGGREKHLGKRGRSAKKVRAR